MLKCKFFYTTFLFFLLICSASFGQTKNGSAEDMAILKGMEDTLVRYADSMLVTGIPDNRVDYCVHFTKTLQRALETPGSFDYPFSALSEKIHILSPDDKSFRIFNWMVAPSNILRRYYGVIQMAGADVVYYPLKDFAAKLEKGVTTAVLPNDKWFGCEYYRILPQVIQGQKAYLLFGFSADGINSNKKLLDVLTFTEQGPLFGTPIFMMPADANGQNVTAQTRIILEYKKTAQVFLNYDDSKKMIMFNRLASDVNDPNRKSTYAPTGQTDGLRFENGQYIFVKDAIPILRLKDGEAPVDGVMKGG